MCFTIILKGIDIKKEETKIIANIFGRLGKKETKITSDLKKCMSSFA